MKAQVDAAQVLEALKKGPFREPAHAWLYEVRNGTGYDKRTRFADAMVISLWPSRGIWFAGIEVKVSRSDWLRELDDPSKSSEIQKYCNFWWIAAAPGIVRESEVPKPWGLIEAPSEKGKAITKIEAPRLTPAALDAGFVASLLRNEAEKVNASWTRGRIDGYQAAKQELDPAKFTALQEELQKEQRESRRVAQQLQYVDADIRRLRSVVLSFERSAGLEEGAIAREAPSLAGSQVGEWFKAAQLLAQMKPAVLAERLRTAAESMQALAATEVRP